MIRISFAIVSAAILTAAATGVPYALGQLSEPTPVVQVDPAVQVRATPTPTPIPASTPARQIVSVNKYQYAVPLNVGSQYITPYHVTFPTFKPVRVYQSTPPAITWQPTPKPVCVGASGVCY